MKTACWLAALLVWVTHVEGEPLFSLESTWIARQGFALEERFSGVEGSMAVSGWTDPGLWLASAVGLDAVTKTTGTFSAIRPYVALRGGVLLPVADWFVLLPWTGIAHGWALAPVGAPSFWAWEAGGEAELRLWSSQSLVAGLAYRRRELVLVLGLRDRTTWRLPPPSVPTVLPPPPTELPPEPARVSVFVETDRFSPDDDGEADLLQLRFETPAQALWNRWSWTVFAPGDQPFYQEQGMGSLPVGAIWDGKSPNQELVSSATDYTVVLEVEDAQGLVTRDQAVFTTDVLLLKDRDRYLIRLPSVNFGANSPGVQTAPQSASDRFQATLLEQNSQTIRRLAEILKKYPQYSITIVGHANLVHWAYPAKAKEEDLKESQPLSLQRAQAVKNALIELGLEAHRINTEGAGGSRPLVPFGDQANSWKNRRVDVILDRKKAEK